MRNFYYHGFGGIVSGYDYHQFPGFDPSSRFQPGVIPLNVVAGSTRVSPTSRPSLGL